MVADRLLDLQLKLQDLSDSAANETKSSAGDKYETARAMLHMEQDQVRRQITELTTQQVLLNSIDAAARPERISPGSLVRIQESVYYLSTGLGRIQVEGQTVFVLSLQSPLGAKLKGLTVGDALTLNDRKIVVSGIN